MELRTAIASDIPVLGDLWVEFMTELHHTEPATPDREGWSSRLGRQIAHAQVYVAVDERRLVGFAGVIDHRDRDFIPPGVAYLVDLYVRPDRRQRKVGTALLDYVSDRAARAGNDQVWTNTSSSNAPALACLAHAQFVPWHGFSLPGLLNQRYFRRWTGAPLVQDGITIRPMVESDDIAVSRLVAEGYRLLAEPDGLTPEQCERLIADRGQPEHMASIRDRHTCHVAEVDASVVGFVAASGDSIEELFVDPGHQRRGIGTALFHRVEDARQGNVLSVHTTGFGLPFYRAMGMHVTGSRRVTCGPLRGRELIQLEKRKTHAAGHHHGA